MNTLIVVYFILGLAIYTLLFCTIPLVMKYRHGPYCIKESIEISFIVCLIATLIILLISMFYSNTTEEVPNNKSYVESVIDGTYNSVNFEKKYTYAPENINFSLIPSILFFVTNICILNIGYKKQ